jgi:adenylylsulfate kinase-like enzyme
MLQENENGIIYISGLSASGKTTLAYRLIKRLHNNNKQVMLMDGTEMYKHSILFPFEGRNLSDREARSSHSVRIAKWISSQGIIPIVAVIGQPVTIRDEWEDQFVNFNEIYLNCSIETCLKRDNKDLYNEKKGGNSIIGIDNQYIPPKDPWLEIKTDNFTPEEVSRIAWENITKLDWMRKIK